MLRLPIIAPLIRKSLVSAAIVPNIRPQSLHPRQALLSQPIAAMSNTQKVNVKSFPPPKALYTPSDLSAEDVASVAQVINPLIANAWAVYLKVGKFHRSRFYSDPALVCVSLTLLYISLKTKNYHWHVSGSHFRDYHLLLDEQADSVLSSIDPLAERLRRIGATTIRSISHIASLQTVNDDNEEYVLPETMIQNLIKDNKHLVTSQRAAHKVAEEARDVATQSLLEDIIDATEKRIWFLHAVIQGGSNVE